jgi:malonate transporter
MLEIFYNILPVFIIVAVGYGAVKSGYLNPAVASSLNSVAVRIAVPILLFRSMYNLDFKLALNWPLLVSFYFGAVASFMLSGLIARYLFDRRPGEAVAVGFCAMFSNTVLLGIPIVERALGSEAMPLVFGIIAFHTPTLYAVGMISMEFARRDGRSFIQTLLVSTRAIFANPLMVGILSGVILNLLSIPLPAVLEASVEMIAGAAIPLALIGVGAAITGYQLNSRKSETITVCLITLLFHPALVFFIAYYLFGLPMQYVQIAVILAAMPPGLNIYIFAVMYDRAVSLSTSTIIAATLCSIFTISGWFWFLSRF